MDAAIEIRGLTKTYSARGGRRAVVDQLSMDVPRAGVHVLLGPAGSGKTTLLRVIAGLVRANRGTVRLRPQRGSRDLGVVFNPANLFGGFSGAYHLELAAQASGVPKDAVFDVLAATNLLARSHDRVRDYSPALRQRLGLALALLRDPEILLLDEPTDGLEPADIEALWALVGARAEAGRTVLISTRQLSQVEAVAETVTVIDQGQAVIDGTVGDIRRAQTTLLEIGVAEADRVGSLLSHTGLNVTHAGGDLLLIADPPDPALITGYLANRRIYVFHLRLRPSRLGGLLADLLGPAEPVSSPDSSDEAGPDSAGSASSTESAGSAEAAGKSTAGRSGEPAKSAKPVEAAEPAEPAKSGGSGSPAKPTGPATSGDLPAGQPPDSGAAASSQRSAPKVESDGPGDQATPSQSGEPTGPAKPARPAKATKPAEAAPSTEAAMAQPDTADSVVEPAAGVTPVVPAESDGPGESIGPTESIGPAESDGPGEPVAPSKPVEPAKSDRPGEAAASAGPVKADASGQAGSAGQADTAGQAGPVVKPAESDEVVAPVKSAAPAKATGPAKSEVPPKPAPPKPAASAKPTAPADPVKPVPPKPDPPKPAASSKPTPPADPVKPAPADSADSARADSARAESGPVQDAARAPAVPDPDVVLPPPDPFDVFALSPSDSAKEEPPLGLEQLLGLDDHPTTGVTSAASASLALEAAIGLSEADMPAEAPSGPTPALPRSAAKPVEPAPEPVDPLDVFVPPPPIELFDRPDPAETRPAGTSSEARP